MTATTRRCALFAGHADRCAVWEHVPDHVEPRNGTRCPERVERPPQHWQRAVTRGQLTREDSRRDVIARSRAAAARLGYRGRISFVKIDTIGPPDFDMYQLRIGVAR